MKAHKQEKVILKKNTINVNTKGSTLRVLKIYFMNYSEMCNISKHLICSLVI